MSTRGQSIGEVALFLFIVMEDFGNFELYVQQAIDNAAERIRGNIAEAESWDESRFGPAVGVDEVLDDKKFYCEIAFGNLLRYLLRRNAISNGRYVRLKELVSAFAEKGIDASGLLTIPVSKSLQEIRTICGKTVQFRNTPRGILTIHVDGMILHHKLCRIRAADWVACFLKALEADEEMNLTIHGIVMSEKISWQTRKNTDQITVDSSDKM